MLTVHITAWTEHHTRAPPSASRSRNLFINNIQTMRNKIFLGMLSNHGSRSNSSTDGRSFSSITNARARNNWPCEDKEEGMGGLSPELPMWNKAWNSFSNFFSAHGVLALAISMMTQPAAHTSMAGLVIMLLVLLSISIDIPKNAVCCFGWCPQRSAFEVVGVVRRGGTLTGKWEQKKSGRNINQY